MQSLMSSGTRPGESGWPPSAPPQLANTTGTGLASGCSSATQNRQINILLFGIVVARGAQLISVIVPAYNEEKRIEQTLRDYSEGLKASGRDFELLVVCDGNDRTAELAKPYGKVLEFGHRLGKGGGVLEGFKAARGEVVGFTDADNSLKVDQFLRLLDEMDHTGAGCVIADRKSKESMIMESQYLIRRFASEAFNFMLSSSIFGLKIRDSQCGGKVFKLEY